MTKKAWTMNEVEWAYRCLFGTEPDFCLTNISADVAIRALDGGYVPPPKPRTELERFEAWWNGDNGPLPVIYLHGSNYSPHDYARAAWLACAREKS